MSGARRGNATSVDLVVVGAGLMGSATAWQAARRGLSVALVEQFAVGHDRGSSHGSARIVRRAYADPLYARLTGEAFDCWRELEEDTGTTLVRMTGGIDHGTPSHVRGVAATLGALGVEHELLDPSAARRRWPGMVFDTDVLFHPQAGTVDAATAVLAATTRAAGLGATVRDRTQVLGLAVRDDGVLVRTDRGEISAPRAVLAAGAWLEPLLAGSAAGLPRPVHLPALTVTEQHVFHFDRRPGVPEWPTVVHEDDVSTYSLPGGRDGGPAGARKVAEHGLPPSATRPGPGYRATSADTRSGVVDPAARDRVVAYVERWLPGLDPTPTAESTCLYTSTATEDFLLDRVGPLVLCSPCSGHGAKFAPLVGRLAVDLATGRTAGGAATVPEARFRLAGAR